MVNYLCWYFRLSILIIVLLLIYRLLLSAVPTSIVYFFLWYVPKWDIEGLKLVYFLLLYLLLEAMLTVSYNRLVLSLYNNLTNGKISQ